MQTDEKPLTVTVTSPVVDTGDTQVNGLILEHSAEYPLNLTDTSSRLGNPEPSITTVVLPFVDPLFGVRDETIGTKAID